jgi:glycogen operon protein
MASRSTIWFPTTDLYQDSGRLPRHSINFITCHDGFTLNDLVSYNRKHNEANGEGNRDGEYENHSSNYGAEGPTANPAIQALRRRQAKNMMATLLLSQGVPMLLAGDEFLRTQLGNNNAWCQDNEVSWIYWELAERNADLHRFTREMIAFRKRHPALRRRSFFRGTGPAGTFRPDVIFHGVEPRKPDFSPTARTLAFALDGSLTGRDPDCDLYIICNAWKEALPFRIPYAPSLMPWRRVIDTALASPQDIVPEGEGLLVPALSEYPVAPYSLVVLVTPTGKS